MTQSELSPVITRYFELVDSSERRHAVEVFTSDAVVGDDGHRYRGHDEILGWLTGAASDYTYTSTRLSAEQNGMNALVVMRLEGDFPGGRVELRYAFELEPSGTLIRSLDIAP